MAVTTGSTTTKTSGGPSGGPGGGSLSAPNRTEASRGETKSYNKDATGGKGTGSSSSTSKSSSSSSTSSSKSSGPDRGPTSAPARSEPSKASSPSSSGSGGKAEGKTSSGTMGSKGGGASTQKPGAGTDSGGKSGGYSTKEKDNGAFGGFGPRADSPTYSTAPTAGLGSYAPQPKDQSRVPAGSTSYAATPEQYNAVKSYNAYVSPTVDKLTIGANSPFADQTVSSYTVGQTYSKPSVPSPMAGKYNPLESISTPGTIATAKFATDMYNDPTIGSVPTPTGRAFNTGVPVSQEEKIAGYGDGYDVLGGIRAPTTPGQTVAKNNGGVSGIMAATIGSTAVASAMPASAPMAPTVGISNIADPNNPYAGNFVGDPNARWNSLNGYGEINPRSLPNQNTIATNTPNPITDAGPFVDKYSYEDPTELAGAVYSTRGVEAPTLMGARTRLTERALMDRFQSTEPETLTVTDNYPVRTPTAAEAEPVRTLTVTDNYPVRTNEYDVVDTFPPSQEGNYPVDANPMQDDGLMDLPDPTEPTIGYVGPVYPGEEDSIEEDGIYGRNPNSWAGGHSTQFNVVPTSAPPPSNPNPGGGGGGGDTDTPWFDSSYNNPTYITEVRAPTITTLAPVSTGVGGLLPNAQFVVVDPFTGQVVNR